MAALDFPLSPSNGDVYQGYVYDATDGVWNRLEAQLDDIGNVTITNPVTGQTLVYNGTGWANGAAAAEGLSPFLLGGM